MDFVQRFVMFNEKVSLMVRRAVSLHGNVPALLTYLLFKTTVVKLSLLSFMSLVCNFKPYA